MLDKLNKKTPQSLRLTGAAAVITFEDNNEKSCIHTTIGCGNIVIFWKVWIPPSSKKTFQSFVCWIVHFIKAWSKRKSIQQNDSDEENKHYHIHIQRSYSENKFCICNKYQDKQIYQNKVYARVTDVDWLVNKCFCYLLKF